MKYMNWDQQALEDSRWGKWYYLPIPKIGNRVSKDHKSWPKPWLLIYLFIYLSTFLLPERNKIFVEQKFAVKLKFVNRTSKIARIKGMLRQNNEHFLQNAFMEKQEFLKWNIEKKFFSVSSGLYFWFLWKYEAPSLHFVFWLINLWGK